MASKSAKLLAERLNCKRLRLSNSTFVPREDDIVINWGNSRRYEHDVTLNEEVCVKHASCKFTTLALIEGFANVPDFTRKREEAQEWLAEGKTIVVRHTLKGNSGEGIEIISEGELPDAPLYTVYVPKKSEYRLHVMGGRVRDIQRKMRKRAVPDEEVNWQVRNTANGFIFGREGVEVSNECQEMAVEAVSALGLDFGAVDIIYNEKMNKYFVLEVNTAPGLCGKTLETYAQYFEEIINNG
jgi:glutathione synthase/RimK-type ligase-like ATP-grasp enzyme